MIVTTSWDDGHPADLRLADLLSKYGIAGTFYVPRHNSEGRPVMGEAEIRQLATSHELGGHSLDHVVLTRLSPDEATRQIADGRKWLEDVIGSTVHGFCYVQGRHNKMVRQITADAGFIYARTVKNLCCDVGTDAFQIPTTAQFYPHTRRTYLKNLLNGGVDRQRINLFVANSKSFDFISSISALFDESLNNGNYFHLWGHAWEIDELNLWSKLEDTLKFLSEQPNNVSYYNNHETWMKASQQCVA